MHPSSMRQTPRPFWFSRRGGRSHNSLSHTVSAFAGDGSLLSFASVLNRDSDADGHPRPSLGIRKELVAHLSSR